MLKFELVEEGDAAVLSLCSVLTDECTTSFRSKPGMGTRVIQRLPAPCPPTIKVPRWPMTKHNLLLRAAMGSRYITPCIHTVFCWLISSLCSPNLRGTDWCVLSVLTIPTSTNGPALQRFGGATGSSSVARSAVEPAVQAKSWNLSACNALLLLNIAT